ncbi:MAG: DUF692 domain-containing protein [Rhabdochlamydiaceae bacterium]|nr:DUF692 domain-containing protein [Rhabdochlamydiaceae bacterium]
MKESGISGVGLGFRREIAQSILTWQHERPSFVEFAPENWMGIGGASRQVLDRVVENYPIACHGLSLSLGSPEPLDWVFLRALKRFFQEIPVRLYSEHLSYCKCDNAHLYDLLPIPFCEEAIKHVVERIRQVQDFLGRQIAIENVSYYCAMQSEMDELSFLTAVLEESDCLLLLDVNNVYVNAFNHGYDAKGFIEKLPLDRVAYMHMAGHEQRFEDLIIDTHGDPIIDPVYALFEWTVGKLSRKVPVLLERDFNFDNFSQIQEELSALRKIVDKQWVRDEQSVYICC